MKKSALSLVFALILLSLSFISAAVEINLEKTQFYPSELLKAEILGTFPDGLKIANIAVYEGNAVHSTPTQSELLKTGEKYIYYAVLPSAEGNYSLKIKNAKYYINTDTSTNETAQNFTITTTNSTYLSINKGFISTTKDFSIIVKSLNGIQEVTAKFDATGEEKTTTIGQNAEKTLYFSIKDITEYTESTLSINDYSIPVFVSPQDPTQEPFITNTTPEDNLTATEPVEVAEEDATPAQLQTCASVNGKLCKSGETCEGDKSFEKGIICCKGTCVKKSSNAWIGGVILIIILVAGAVWFYLKTKKSNTKTGEEKLAETSERFKSRMNPQLSQSEVNKKLARE